MQHRTITGVTTLALIATLLTPSLSFAKESEKTRLPRVPSLLAIDGKGDDHGNKEFKKHNDNRRLYKVSGKVKSISATSITITKPNRTELSEANKETTVTATATTTDLTFVIDAKTNILRKFKGTATYNEIMVGDVVQIWAAKKSGTALIIWDKSIWYSETKGVISNLNADGKAFTLTVTKDKIEYQTTVKFDAMTTFLMKDGTTKLATDLANGQTVKIKGAWDTVGKFLLAKRIVIYPASL